MIVLASKSASRQAMLTAAGVSFRSIPADLDERGLEAALGGAAPGEIALALAEAKAQAVSAKLPDELVLGSDSLVDVAGQRFDKPRDRTEAAAHLRFFSSKTMHLHSSAVISRGGVPLWRHAECAELRVRALSDAFIADYLDAEWPLVAGCVGVFRLEAMGVQLFDAIEGSHFTVLGMPLLPVLAALRGLGVLAA